MCSDVWDQYLMNSLGSYNCLLCYILQCVHPWCWTGLHCWIWILYHNSGTKVLFLLLARLGADSVSITNIPGNNPDTHTENFFWYPIHWKLSERKWKFSCSVMYDSLLLHGLYSLPGSSIHGIFQVRVLQWIAISFSRGFSQARDRTWVSHIIGRHFTIWAIREVYSGKIPEILFR